MSNQHTNQFKAWDPSYPESFFIMGEINGVHGIFTVGEGYIKTIPNNSTLINLNLSAFTIATRAIGKANDMTRQEQQNNEKTKVDILNDEAANNGIPNADDGLHSSGHVNLFSRLFTITLILFSTFVLMANIATSESLLYSSTVWLKLFMISLVGAITAVACICINREFKGGES